MSTLILSANTGEGHNSCAKAIKEYYDFVGEECVCIDGLTFISPQAAQIFAKGHSFVYRYTPWLFKYGYSYTEEHPNIFQDGSTVYRFMTQGSERMFRYISDGGYDTVVCVHPFTAFMLTDMLNKYPMKNDLPFEPNAAMRLDDNLVVAMQKMERMNAILETLQSGH